MKKTLIPAFISALALALSFAPFGLWPLAWVALVPLFLLLDRISFKGALSAGYVFGFVFFLSTLYWVVNSMYDFGGVPLYLSILVMLLLVAYMAIYPAIFGLLFMLFKKGLFSPFAYVAVPGAWVALEYCRGYLFTGLPWVLMGYTQAPFPPALQLSDVTGVWGISFAIVLVNYALFRAIRPLLDKGAVCKTGLTAATIVFISLIVYGHAKMEEVQNDVAKWRTRRISVAQGNIAQDVKWVKGFGERTIAIYSGLTDRAVKDGSVAVVWPETAVPYYLSDDATGQKAQAVQKAVADIAKRGNIFVLTGTPSYRYEYNGLERKYFNSAYLFSTTGEVSGIYDKIHLVPFGEYVPLRDVLFFVKKLTVGAEDFSSGIGTNPLTGDGLAFGPLICFESVFPELSRGFVLNGALVLANLTNDAWFGRSSAPYQHFDMSIVRAVENRSYLVRSANTGISAVIDPTGVVRVKTGLFEEALITYDVGLRQGEYSAYTLHGDVFAAACIVMTAVFMIVSITRRKVKAQGKDR